MIINKANLSNLFTGFIATFQKAFDGAKSDHERIVTIVPSTTSAEQYAWLGSVTRFREWIGDRVLQSLKTFDYTIKNKDWENTVEIPANAIEDDEYGVYTPVIAQMGQDSKEHPAELAWGALKNGFTNKCYDGQYFFDTDHPVLDADGNETTVSNFGGGSGTAWYLLDTSRMIKPIILQMRKPYNFVRKDSDEDDNKFFRKTVIYGVDARLNVGYALWQLAYASKQTLDAASFNAAYAAMTGLKGDNGKPLGVRPTILVVPPSLRATALEVVKAAVDAAGKTNINQNVVEVLDTAWVM